MKKFKYLVLTFLFTLPVSAQDEIGAQGFLEQYLVNIVLGLAVIVCLVAILGMYVMLAAMRTMLHSKSGEREVEEKTGLIKIKEGEEGVGFWGRFWNRLNESVPLTKEETIVTNHEYDGIRELDNRLPSWWLWGFYFTILFGVAYLAYYHIGNGQSQHEEFASVMKEAEKEVKAYLASLDNLVDENSAVVTTTTVDLGAGQVIYEENCAVCHATDGGGGVGPNFTDKYWLHGGDIKDIFFTIKYGVPEKGMISWESQLSPAKIQQVSSYIYMMEGTIPGNPKDSQGDLFERAPVEEEAPADTTAIVSNGGL